MFYRSHTVSQQHVLHVRGELVLGGFVCFLGRNRKHYQRLLPRLNSGAFGCVVYRVEHRTRPHTTHKHLAVHQNVLLQCVRVESEHVAVP